MRRVGEVVDAATVCTAAAVAGVTLFLPDTIDSYGEATPYQIASLLDSAPRSAALAVVIAVTTAVLVTMTARPLAGWIAAMLAMLVELLNDFAGGRAPTAEMLTTQNYIDSMCAGVVLGGLGAAVLRRPLAGAALAVGSIGFFSFGDLAEFLGIERNPYAMLQTPPHWMLEIALTLLVISVFRNWAHTREPKEPQLSITLPVAPIIAAMVLASAVLAGTAWLSRQYDKLPAASHTIEIGVVVAATLVSATAAAMLLPGRDGTGVYLAVSFTPAVGAMGYAVQSGWGAVVLLTLTAIGVAIGSRLSSAALAILLIIILAIVAMLTPAVTEPVAFAAVSAFIAITAGYCCGTARPRYAPSGVLAITALYLPTVVSAIPNMHSDWRHDAQIHETLPGRAALAIAIGSAVGLAALHKLRPRNTAPPEGGSETDRHRA
ncbi:hypothetical protein ACL02S_06455 [Nocardia sp. 004]|uniref:hypothetical protein n=1 Tax=Nocardia sp. 004 TaxID=3385978 RepID=UPI0039A06FD9